MTTTDTPIEYYLTLTGHVCNRVPLSELYLDQIAENAWQGAHDDFCDFGAKCSLHLNPYRIVS